MEAKCIVNVMCTQTITKLPLWSLGKLSSMKPVLGVPKTGWGLLLQELEGRANWDWRLGLPVHRDNIHKALASLPLRRPMAPVRMHGKMQISHAMVRQAKEKAV